MKRKFFVVGLLLCSMVLQMLGTFEVFAKTKNNVPITSLTSIETEGKVEVSGNELRLTDKNAKSKKSKQQWKIEPVDRVFCTIKSDYNGKILAVEQDKNGEWDVLLVKKATLEDEQLWYVEICDEDTYRIKSKLNDLCLKVEKKDDGAHSFSLGEEEKSCEQFWRIDEKAYNYANQYFTYLEEQDPELVSMKEQIQIENLQNERNKLFEDYEENIDEIEKIDGELERLGAIELSNEEAMVKMGEGEEGVFSKARVATYPTSSGVVWSSFRFCVAYNGKIIELQTLVGKPQSGATSSALISEKTLVVTSGGFEAGVRNLLFAISQKVVGCTPEIGGDLAKAITVYSWAKAYISGISSKTLVSNVKETYIISQLGETKIVFAKYQGSADSTQILAYKGNKTNVTVTSVCSSWPQYSSYIEHTAKTIKGTYASPKYSSEYKSYAAKLYYNYKNNISDMNAYFTLYSFPLELIDKKQYSISVPRY